MLNDKIKGLVAGIVIGSTLTGGVVFAKSGTQTIDVIYDNIKVYKDNQLCELKDSNGTVIEPFIYNGTTYMPVRGAAQLANMDVTWDGATKSVYLWDEASEPGTCLLEVCPPYETSRYTNYLWKDGKTYTMSGKQYSDGFTLGYAYNTSYALFNLDSKYSRIKFTIGHVDGSNMYDAKVNIYLDGEFYKSIEVGAEDLPKTVSIPVNYALQMKIERERGDAKTGFADVQFEQ